MDRINIQKEVHPVDFFVIADQKPCCSSEELRLKVKKMQRMFTKQMQLGIKAKDSGLCFRICTETGYNCQRQKIASGKL